MLVLKNRLSRPGLRSVGGPHAAPLQPPTKRSWTCCAIMNIVDKMVASAAQDTLFLLTNELAKELRLYSAELLLAWEEEEREERPPRQGEEGEERPQSCESSFINKSCQTPPSIHLLEWKAQHSIQYCSSPWFRGSIVCSAIPHAIRSPTESNQGQPWKVQSCQLI